MCWSIVFFVMAQVPDPMGLKIEMKVTSWSPTKEASIDVSFSRAPGPSKWLIKAIEPFAVHYYDKNNKAIKSIDMLVPLGDDFASGKSNTASFSLEIPAVVDAHQVSIEFGDTGVISRRVLLNTKNR